MSRNNDAEYKKIVVGLFVVEFESVWHDRSHLWSDGGANMRGNCRKVVPVKTTKIISDSLVYICVKWFTV